jgi:hypothetical protein
VLQEVALHASVHSTFKSFRFIAVFCIVCLLLAHAFAAQVMSYDCILGLRSFAFRSIESGILQYALINTSNEMSLHLEKPGRERVHMLAGRQLKDSSQRGVTVRDSQEVHLVRSCSEPSHARATANVGAIPVGPGTNPRPTCPRFRDKLKASPVPCVVCACSHVCTCAARCFT